MTIADIKKNTESKMDQSIAAFSNNLTKIRTGRAHPSLLEGIRVNYYGSETPLKQVAQVSVLLSVFASPAGTGGASDSLSGDSTADVVAILIHGVIFIRRHA